MNDRARFEKLAEESLAVLHRIAGALPADSPAGVARADALRSHARHLYEYAFMAGAAERRERCDGRSGTS